MDEQLLSVLYTYNQRSSDLTTILLGPRVRAQVTRSNLRQAAGGLACRLTRAHTWITSSRALYRDRRQ